MITKIFEPILGKTMNAYIDDMVVKSKREPDHVRNLTEVFTILRRHKLRLNAMKCAFGGEIGKILRALDDRTRDRGKFGTNYSDQQPHQPKDCEGGSKTNRNGSNTKYMH